MPSHGSSLPHLVDDAHVDAGQRQSVPRQQIVALLVRAARSRWLFSAITVAIGVVSVMPHASMKRMPYFCLIPFDELPRQRRTRADDRAQARNIVLLVLQKAVQAHPQRRHAGGERRALAFDHAGRCRPAADGAR